MINQSCSRPAGRGGAVVRVAAEAEDAWRLVTRLVAMVEWVAQVHDFSNGIGLSAPQVSGGRRRVMSAPEEQTLTLLNPRIYSVSI